MSDLVGNPEDRFSDVAAHFSDGLSCKVDELEYYTDEGLKCLKVLTDTLVTYEEAQENCTQLGGHLVTEKEAVSSASLGYLVLPK